MPSCRFRGYCVVKKFGNVLFSKYLLYTNVATSVILTTIADFTEQKIMNQIREEVVDWDKKRTGKVVLIGGVFGGLASHHWFHFLEKKIPGQSLGTVMKKVWYDQTVFSPAYTLFYFMTLDLMDNHSIKHMKNEVKEKAWILIASEIIVMPPLQFINFYFVKPKYRAIYDYGLSLILLCFTSYVKYDYPSSHH